MYTRKEVSDTVKGLALIAKLYLFKARLTLGGFIEGKAESLTEPLG